MKIKSDLYVIGLDCGSLSARAAVIRVSDGQVISEAGAAYPDGIINGKMPDGETIPDDYFISGAEDYLTVLPLTVRRAVKKAGIKPEQIIGVGADATSCTLVPCAEDGTPLSSLEQYKNRVHAYIKLWKHHCVQKQADRITAVAKKRNEEFLLRFGGEASCEWMLPKVMQIYEEDPEIYARTAYYLDMCDWLSWRMTGVLTRGADPAGFKGLWSSEKGDISDAFLNELYPGFGLSYRKKALNGKVIENGKQCGMLCHSASEWLGLPEGIAVSSGMMDGHASSIGAGMRNSGEATLIIGTSNAIPFLSDRFLSVKGISGIVKDGIIPGLFGCVAGQFATGDMLGWLIENAIPASYEREAEKLNCTMHELLTAKARKSIPERNRLSVLDWWNGNRSILNNPLLKGNIWGLTLDTRPEDIYCAMLQGIACGTKVIFDQCHTGGLKISRVIACGGVPCKNGFFMQQYANILGKDIYAAKFPNSSALGSAVCAASAAGEENGGYDTLTDAMKHMSIHDFTEYHPSKENMHAYEVIYDRYHTLYDLLGSTILN